MRSLKFSGHTTRRIAFATLGLTSILASCAPVPVPVDEGTNAAIESPVVGRRRLRVDGPRLRDELGREVILRGYNAGGRAKMAPYLPFDLAAGETVAQGADRYFGRIASLGANVVRLVFSWEAYEPTRGNYDAAYLARYEAMLDAADARGIAVIVDFHQDVFASPFCGDGFPLWALGPIPHGAPHYDCKFPYWSLPAFNPLSPTSAGFDRLWNDRDGLQGAMEAMWRRVASEFAEHPAVAGFEIMNEPGAGSVGNARLDAEVLPAFYERMGRAIREVAGDVPIFWDTRIGATGVPEGLRPPAIPGAVFAPHYYEQMIAIGVPVVRTDVITRDLRATFAPTETWGMPVLLGEFGVPNGNLAKAGYLDTVLDLVDDLRGHATMWDASLSPTLWNSEDFSVFDASGREQSWVPRVVRAYPRAVAGRIVRFRWEFDTKRFDLEVASATVGTTEVYLPRRHLGTVPRITITGGATYNFDSARELLLISAPAGSAYVLTVTR
jgi:endoglycosylceramidase